ncbi:MAG: HAD family phosphatase [Candidatus Omnitrophota bacterium]
MVLKLILCDLGNVLVNFDHRIAVRKIMPFTQKGFDEVHQLFFDSKLTKDFEEGRLKPRDFFRRLCRILGIKNISFDRFVPIWNEIFSDNKPMAALLGALKKRHKLYLISNINKLHYDYIAGKFGRYIGLFDKCYLSYEVGFRKPHVDIYRKAMLGANVKPQECLYIDDRADLIKEAKKLGLRPILFKNVSDLKKQLRKMKVSF